MNNMMEWRTLDPTLPLMISNGLQTPDGTIIYSRSRHDYVTHLDANGREYMIDGGLDYVRSSAWGDEQLMTVTIEHDHEQVREACVWGTYGINGDQPLHYKKLADMDRDHINAVLETSSQMHRGIKTAMINELEYRRNNKDKIIT
jgi:hypothetical protein